MSKKNELNCTFGTSYMIYTKLVAKVNDVNYGF